MEIVHISHSDINGGAARATYRIHYALRGSDVDSTMSVNVAESGDWTVRGPETILGKTKARSRQLFGVLLCKTLETENTVIHSPSILPSNRVKQINDSEIDLVHLHWVTGEMLSIADIGRIKKPIVWTLHDMWPFCGAEHYTEDYRWREGYRKDNRPAYESRFDLNRWTWKRKIKHWKRPMHIVTPSQWLADCARQSVLMQDWPVTVVPNCLDTDRWQPIEKHFARDLLGLPKDAPLLLFGAMGGGRDPRKGFDLLLATLELMHGNIPDLELVVFGQLAPHQPPDLGFPVHYVGHMHDDLSLQALYSAADMLVIPSRQDNLPNAGVEAHACGTPVVAFNVGGLSDIVEHEQTGYLAKAFDTEDLAYGIKWVLKNSENAQLGQNARVRAVARFSNEVVAEQYREVYKKVL